MNLQNVDLRLLRVFATVVDHGGFGPAAAALNLTQPTISNHLAALESRLGRVLCARGRAGFRLTEEGAAVYVAAQKLFDAAAQFILEVDAGSVGPRGTVRLGILDGLIHDHPSILTALEQFGERAVAVRLEISSLDTARLSSELINSRLDMCISVHPSGTNLARSPLHGATVGTERARLYCGRRSILFGTDGPLTRDQIRHAPVIANARWFGEDLKHIGQLRAHATAETLDASVMLLVAGPHIGFLPVDFAERLVESGQLRQAATDMCELESDIFVAGRRGGPFSLAAFTLYKTLVSTFSASTVQDG